MRWSALDCTPSPRKLRHFAGLCLLFFGGLACWQGLGRGNAGAAVLLAALAATLGPAGLAWPRAVRPVYVGWTAATFPVGWVLSQLASAVVYYALVTPLALGLRLAGRDLLYLRRRPTYWLPRPTPADPRSYGRPF